ncbi:MAG: hypothetical protein HYZ65_01025 [Burkholderiales bacterium]|nr:hypothetical protein [Burkholderiales bacterium]
MKHQYSRSPSLPKGNHNPERLPYDLLADGAKWSEAGFLVYLGNDYTSDFAFGGDADDDIDFLEEEEPASGPRVEAHPWKILIADDDSNVHETTLLALSGVRIHGKPLEFLHAYSAKEAQSVIRQHPDMALVLLDVVMETVDAGLKLVNIIRNELGLNNLRIVLRTGQPGYAPEQQVSREFAIDGYTTKSKLTRSILISVLNDTLARSGGHKELPN